MANRHTIVNLAPKNADISRPNANFIQNFLAAPASQRHENNLAK